MFAAPSRIIGNIGESLNHGADPADEDGHSAAGAVYNIRRDCEHQLPDLPGDDSSVGGPVAGPSYLGQDDMPSLKAVGTAITV